MSSKEPSTVNSSYSPVFTDPYETKKNQQAQESGTDKKINQSAVRTMKQQQSQALEWELYQGRLLGLGMEQPEQLHPQQLALDIPPDETDADELIHLMADELEKARLSLKKTKTALKAAETNTQVFKNSHMKHIERVKSAVSNKNPPNHTLLFFASFFSDCRNMSIASLLSQQALHQTFLAGYSGLLSELNFQENGEELSIEMIGNAEMLLREHHGVLSLLQEVDFLSLDRKNLTFRYAAEFNPNLNFASPEAFASRESLIKWERLGVNIKPLTEWFERKLKEKKISFKLHPANLVFADLILRAHAAIEKVMGVVNNHFSKPQSYQSLLELEMQIQHLKLNGLGLTVLPQLITHGKWPNLKTLSISDNPLDHIPSGSFLSMSSLKEFDACDTLICLFPHDILRSSIELTKIDFSSSCLNGLSPEASEMMSQLKTVNVGPYRLEDIVLEYSPFELAGLEGICQIADLAKDYQNFDDINRFFNLLDAQFSIIMDREIGLDKIVGWFSALRALREHKSFPAVSFKDLNSILKHADKQIESNLKSLYIHVLAAHGIVFSQNEGFETYEKALDALAVANTTLKTVNIATQEAQQKDAPALPKAKNYYDLCLLQKQGQLNHIICLNFPIMMKRIPNFILQLPNLAELIFPENSPLFFDKSQIQNTKIEKIWIGTKKAFEHHK